MGLLGYQPSHPPSWVYQDYTDNDLHLAKIHIRHIQANTWVYQATIQAILPVGFIRLTQTMIYTYPKFIQVTAKTTDGFIRIPAKPSFHLGLSGGQGGGKTYF